MVTAYIEDVALPTGTAEDARGKATATYDAVADSLTFWLAPEPLPHTVLPVNDYVSLLGVFPTGAVRGIQIDNFLAFAVHEYPGIMPLARFLKLVPRAYGDTDLFAGRLVRVATPFDEGLARQAKVIISGVVHLTGGYDPDRISIGT